MVELGNTDKFQYTCKNGENLGCILLWMLHLLYFYDIKKSALVVNVIIFINHIIYFFIFCIHAILKVEAQLELV